MFISLVKTNKVVALQICMGSNNSIRKYFILFIWILSNLLNWISFRKGQKTFRYSWSTTLTKIYVHVMLLRWLWRCFDGGYYLPICSELQINGSHREFIILFGFYVIKRINIFSILFFLSGNIGSGLVVRLGWVFY